MTQGIDVSMFQGDIDFNKVKASGYTFVIIRINNWNQTKKCVEIDPYFVKNYNGAKAAGLHVGAYWFTFANKLEYLRDVEIPMCKSVLKGKSFEYPIYLDLERGEQFNQGKEFCDKMVETFCNEIEKFNGFAGVYCSRYWYTTKVSLAIRERYACWIADWASQCKYTGSYGIWQNGSATVNGVKGEVDHDYAYIDYPSIIKKSGRNDWTEKQTDWKQMYDVLFGQNKEALEKIKKLEAENKNMKQAIEYADSALKGVL